LVCGKVIYNPGPLILSDFIAEFSMTDQQPVVIQKISWADLCPWIVIFRTLPIATSFTVLALATLAVVATPVGWRMSEGVLSAESQLRLDDLAVNRSPYRGVFASTPDGVEPMEVLGVRLTGPREIFRQTVNPFKRLFDRKTNLREFCYYLFGSLWTVAIWSFVGLAICRVSLLRLTRGEHAGLDDAFEFSVDHWARAIGAVLAPLMAVAGLCIPTFLIGLLMGFDLGLLVIGIAWFLVVAISIVMGILLLGLMFGWPLMIASVACEGQTSFDSLTRSFAYVFQRPFHYLFYAILAMVFGGVCWLVVASVADGMVGLTFWSVSWGANIADAGRVDVIFDGPPLNEEGVSTESQSMYVGRMAISFWNAVIKSLAAAFLYGMFWCLASAIYLLLRHDVDESEMDEIFVVNEKRTYKLPPLRSDANGIPQVRRPEPSYSAEDGDSTAPDQVSPDDIDRDQI
jgi:hypothetical protein